MTLEDGFYVVSLGVFIALFIYLLATFWGVDEDQNSDE